MQYPVAASVAVSPLLQGPRRTVEVAAVTTSVVYLATGDPLHPALCLAGAGAGRMPFALICGRALPGGSRVGQTGTIEAGRLTLGASTARVGRWWRPRRPSGLSEAPHARLRAAACHLAARVPVLRGYSQSIAELVQALDWQAPLEAPAARLLGRGPGLTPLGDDVLAGALATLVALESPAAGRLGAAVLAHAPDRTTFVSAALLHHAARGESVPELTALLVAARDGGAQRLSAATDRLLRVGHTSGAGLAIGVLAGLDYASR
jgi:hypothetical protein